MASTARIDGSLPAGSAGSTTALIFSRGFAVEYDWVADRALASGQPRRLNALSFPAPFDADLEGVLRGRGAFSDFLYLFKGGQYLRLREATMTPDGPPAATAPAWGLPAHWTSFDAVFPGGGIKIGFSYFFRGDEYCRFDWSTDRLSPGYPKKIASEWHTTPPFDRDFDGVIVGQGSFSTKAYLFKTITASVDQDGNPVAPGTPGSRAVAVPAYIRYDFDAENTQGSVTNPVDVVANWPGLMPLLDTGPAMEVALVWCDRALVALAAPMVPATSAALSHHFMTPTPAPAQLATIAARLAAVRGRVALIPDRFQWTPGIGFAAQTTPQTLIEIGDQFSTFHGPNGRAAVLIHESVHFTHTGGPAVDVPEWSGETVNGVPFGVDSISGTVYHTITTDQATTNPGSYASFAQEIGVPGDTRFGAARPHE
jgi:hypothetical protein